MVHYTNVSQSNQYILPWSHPRLLLDQIAWSPQCLLLRTYSLTLPFHKCTGAVYGDYSWSSWVYLSLSHHSEQATRQQSIFNHMNPFTSISNRVDQQPWAVETHTANDLHCLGEKSNMENGFGELNMTKMPRTGGHVPCTCLTAWHPVHHSLARIHEAIEFWATAFHCVGVLDAIWHRHGHAFLP